MVAIRDSVLPSTRNCFDGDDLEAIERILARNQVPDSETDKADESCS